VSIQDQYSATPNQGGWFLIGEDLPFEAGTAGYVQLSNNTGNTGLVSADAVKFVLRPDATPPTTPVVTDEGVWTASRTTLSASWTADDPESGIKRFEYRLVESGGAVVRDWTPTGLDVQVEVAGLALAIGKSYVF